MKNPDFFTRDQAQLLAEEQNSLIDERLATKTDLEELRLATQADIAASESKLLIEADKSKSAIIKWVPGMLIAQTAFLYGVAKLHG